MTPRASVLVAITLAASSIALVAQTATRQTFEVASVKETAPDTSGSPLAMMPRLMPPVNGRFSAANVPLRMIVRMAYEVQDFQIVGGPSWFMTKRFDIQAKAEDGFTSDAKAMLPLIRTLLEERFALKSHVEKREMPVSSLVVARSDGKLGPDLKPSTADCPDPAVTAQRMQETLARGDTAALIRQMQNGGPCSVGPVMGTAGAMSMGIRGNGQPISGIVSLLTGTTGRLVLDHTGLKGLYDFQLVFDPSVMMQMVSQLGVAMPAGAQLPQSDAPALLTAIQEQLGLKLVTKKGMVDVLVIDSAALPTPD